MPCRSKLTKAEIQAAFSGASPILSPAQFAALVGIKCSTIYEWISKGRFAGACRKRGKHQLILRDRAIDILFNGADWK